MNNGTALLLKWECKFFNALSVSELYQILRLRNEVFVVEQNCIFQDADNMDQNCYHLSGWHSETLVAYARLATPGLIYEEASIGRVVGSPQYRGTGVGKALMEQAIVQCRQLFGDIAIKIGAQLYLKKFYELFGFRQISDVYLEDGIKHIKMILIFM